MRSAEESDLPVEFIDPKMSCGLSWPCVSEMDTTSRRAGGNERPLLHHHH